MQCDLLAGVVWLHGSAPLLELTPEILQVIALVAEIMLDASGPALFGWVVSPDMTALRWRFPGIYVNFQPASAGVRSSGCYEWDVIGDGFREKIVFKATLG